MPEEPRPPKAHPSPPPIVLDPVTGHMTLWGVRVWIMPPEYHAGMQAELEPLSGKAAKGMLYRVAFRSGRSAAEALGLTHSNRTTEPEVRERLRRIEQITFTTGHGASAVSIGDFADRDVTLTMADSALARLHPPSKEPVCHYYEGFFAGFVSGILGTPVEAVETECRAKGDARCTFRTHAAAAAPV